MGLKKNEIQDTIAAKKRHLENGPPPKQQENRL
jgi:hypothetical protein